MAEFLDSKDLGAKLRQLRQLAGMSQELLGEKVGLTAQQIHKYESGRNAFSINRVQEFAEIFSVPIQEFFCQYTEVIHLTESERALLDSFRAVRNPEIQDSILKLTTHAAKVKEE